MPKPVLLDCMCGAGGCTRGYQEAGFFVVGIDKEPMANYCGDNFIQGDALEVLAVLLDGGEVEGRSDRRYRLEDFSCIHASPPCQNRSPLKSLWQDREHPELIAETRELLVLAGLPYVIENVERAREVLIEPVMLCGSVFGLGVRRHRLFETNFPLQAPGCAHRFQLHPVPVYGHSGAGANRGLERERGRTNTVEDWRRAMGIDWMTGRQLAQAIPPAYTRHVGSYLLTHLQSMVREAA